jgi:hypothetical protein
MPKNKKTAQASEITTGYSAVLISKKVSGNTVSDIFAAILQIPDPLRRVLPLPPPLRLSLLCKNR